MVSLVDGSSIYFVIFSYALLKDYTIAFILFICPATNSLLIHSLWTTQLLVYSIENMLN